MSRMPRTPLLRFARGAAVLASVALAGFAVTACGAGASTPSATPAVAAATRTGGPGPGGGQRIPGVSGLIAAVDGTTMQVQSSTKQTAVGWTATTSVARTAAGTLADIVAGSCVVVRSASSDGSAPDAGGGVTATSVQVSAAVNGACADVFGGGIRGGGGIPSGMPTGQPGVDQLPPGATVGAPGGPGGRVPGGFGVVGLVTQVGSGTFTVASLTRVGDGGPGTASAAPAQTTPVTVTTSASTTVTTTKVAAAGDIAVGLCATAIGPTDDIGKVTATSIVLRDAVNGACTSTGGFDGPGAPGAGFPGGGGPGGGGPGGGGPGGAAPTSAATNG